MATDIKKTILVELGIDKANFLQDAASTQEKIANLTAEQKRLKDSGQELSAEYQQNIASLKNLKQELSTAQKSAANFDKSLQSNTGSLAQQKAELSVLTSQYDKFSAEEKKTSDVAKTLAIAIRKISDSLKEEEKSLGNNTRNVGNYEEAINGLKGSLGGYVKQNQDLGPLYEGLESGLQALNNITSQFANNQKELNDVIDAQKKYLNATKVAQEAKIAADLAEKEATEAVTLASQGKITADELAIIQARAQTLAIEAQTAATVVQTSSINLNIASLKLLRLALIGTGIGAIIILLASFIAYLANTQEGIDKITSVTRPLIAIFKSLLGAAQNLGKSLFEAFSNPKKLLSDFLSFLGGQVINRIKAFRVILEGLKNFDLNQVSNGLFQATTGVENLTGKIKNAAGATSKFLTDAAKKGVEIDRISKEIEKSQLRYNENQIKFNDAVDQQLLISKDISNSYAERERASREIIRLTKANGDEEQRIIEKKIKRLKIEQSLNDAGREGKQELIDLQTELDAAGDRDLDAEKEQLKVIGGFKKEQKNLAKQQAVKAAADTKALNEEIAKAEFDLSQKLNSAYDQELASVQKKYDDLKEKAQGNIIALKKIEELRKQEVDELEIKHQKELATQLSDLEKQRIEQKLTTIKDNFSLEIELRTQLLQINRDNELANLELTETQKLAIKEKYQFQEQQLLENYRVNIEQQKIDIAQREIDSEQQIADAKEDFEARKRELAYQGLALAQEIFAKNTVIGKLAFALEKGLALASVVIQTQKALLANRVSEEFQKTAVAGIPFVGPVLVTAIAAKSKVERGLITIGGIISGASIAATAIKGFRYGGVFKSQGGGLVVGPGNAISDSINAKLSNGEAVMTARAVQMFKPQLSAMNVAGGGHSFEGVKTTARFADGGIFDGGYSAKFQTPNQISATDISVAVANAVKDITIITDIRDITSAADKQNANISRVTY